MNDTQLKDVGHEGRDIGNKDVNKSMEDLSCLASWQGKQKYVHVRRRLYIRLNPL